MRKHIGQFFFRITPWVAVLLIVLQIILTNQLVGGGSKMQSVDITIDALREENALLGQQVASASSLTTIANRANEMGFSIPVKNQFVTMTADLPVALNNTH